jgi:hypothetical protein
MAFKVLDPVVRTDHQAAHGLDGIVGHIVHLYRDGLSCEVEFPLTVGKKMVTMPLSDLASAVEPLQSLESFNAERRKVYESDWPRPTPKLNGISCPKCGTELVDSDPNITLASNPPQKSVRCPSCAWKGLRIA